MDVDVFCTFAADPEAEDVLVKDAAAAATAAGACEGGGPSAMGTGCTGIGVELVLDGDASDIARRSTGACNA